MSKKSEIVKVNDEGSEQNVQQMSTANIPANSKTDDKNQLGGSELFSFFTANIIKEEKVFTR